MSYEIIYDKQFIKVKDKFLPFVLAGSNNCYENTCSGRERRERSWWLWSPDYSSGIMIPMTKTEMINHCRKNLAKYIEQNKDRGEDYNEENIRKRYGYFTSLAINSTTHKTSYKTYENIYAIGCDNAITIEELHGYHGTLSIETGCYYEKELKEKGLEAFSEPISDENHFYEVYNEKIEKYGNLLRISIRMGESVPKRVRRYKKGNEPTKKSEETVYVRLDGYYTIEAPNGNYFYKNSRNGYRYSYNPYHKFATEREAKKFCYGKRNAVVKKEEGEAQIYVKKSIVEKLTNVLAKWD